MELGESGASVEEVLMSLSVILSRTSYSLSGSCTLNFYSNFYQKSFHLSFKSTGYMRMFMQVPGSFKLSQRKRGINQRETSVLLQTVPLKLSLFLL